MLKRIFGPKKEDVSERWRRLHNEELHNLYPSPNSIRQDHIKENEMHRACIMHGRGEMHK
jgi:hypothetical protein